jgi:hypothetical protein
MTIMGGMGDFVTSELDPIHIVIAGLDPAISQPRNPMRGSSPRMTEYVG